MENNSALIIVDIQNDFCQTGALAVPHGDEVVEPVNLLKEIFEHENESHGAHHQIIATRDWHPQNSQHFMPNGGQWPVHCIAGTVGAGFHERLDINGVHILSKGVSPEEDGYSPFSGKLDDTGESLHQFLQRGAVGIVWIVGLATDFCVKAAALDAQALGYQVYLVHDACQAVNLQPNDGTYALGEMIRAGVVLISVEATIQSINPDLGGRDG